MSGAEPIEMSSDEEMQYVGTFPKGYKVPEDDNGTTSMTAEQRRKRLRKENEISFTYLRPPANLPVGEREPGHVCNEECVSHLPQRQQYVRDEVCSPFFEPLRYGWTRTKREQKEITYTAPCGREFTDPDGLQQIVEYLWTTRSAVLHGLTIDQFTFDADIKPNKISRLSRNGVLRADIGSEHVPVPVVNNVDDLRFEVEKSMDFTYNPERSVLCWLGPEATNDANRELYKEFCAGCDCVDDCSNMGTCACRQRTIERLSTICKDLQPVDPDINGYYFRRLKDADQTILSGIFECNQMCQCHDSCVNRVAQNGLRIPLEVYKTAEMGYGVRTRVDLPHDLLSNFEEEARECMRKHRNAGIEAEEEEDVGDLCVIEPAAGGFYSLKDKFMTDGIKLNPTIPHRFVADPLTQGNVGRFFNHSCAPNLVDHFVFHDTHDVRLPLIAFFTNQFVKAGTPLTWKYGEKYKFTDNGKEVPCRCDACSAASNAKRSRKN